MFLFLFYAYHRGIPWFLAPKLTNMPDTSVVSADSSPLKALWTNKLRSNLHNPSNWNQSNDCKLVHVPTGIGFYGQDQMKKYFEKYGTFDIFNEGIQSVSCTVEESTGRIFDEFVLDWTQIRSRMEWMLPGLDFPLQKYRLSFVISAQIDPITKLIQSARVYWDQASILLQSGILMRSIKHLMRPNTSEALENALTSLPISSNRYRGLLFNTFVSDEDKPVLGGGLNSITSILSDLPRSTSGPAVLTPQRPASSRSLNPALLGTLKFGDDQPFDSPLPANTRNVKSRNIFFEDAEEIAAKQKKQPVQMGLFDKMASPDSYRPGLASNAVSNNNSTSHVFDKDVQPEKYNPSLHLNETFTHQYESKIFAPSSPIKKTSNLPQTDKILFESHVFDTDSNQQELQQHVATAPPQSSSHILSPEENLKCQPETVSATLSRPGMLGHFRGASFGDTLTGDDSLGTSTKYIPSTAIRFDPNKSQIFLGGYVPEDEEKTFVPTSRVSAPPGGKSSIFD